MVAAAKHRTTYDEVGNAEWKAQKTWELWKEEFGTLSRWHNYYLYATIALALTSALFAGLFGGYYSAWHALDECAHRRIVDADPYNSSAYCLMYATGSGLAAVEGGTCPHTCDQRLYDKAEKVPALPVEGLSSSQRIDLCRASMASVEHEKFNASDVSAEQKIHEAEMLYVSCEYDRSCESLHVLPDNYRHRLCTYGQLLARWKTLATSTAAKANDIGKCIEQASSGSTSKARLAALETCEAETMILYGAQTVAS
jgi:hypothetical protein